MDATNSSMTEYLLPKGHGPHITQLKNQRISKLAPFGALILSIILVNYFFIRYYILEGFLLKRVYGKTYTDLKERDRRGFVNHHIAGSTKIVILLLAAYPFIYNIVKGDFHSKFVGQVTIGDILIIAAQMLIGMYVFELFYRADVSYVSVGHHVGTIMIGQAAIAISLDLVKEKDATIEFTLCTVWGAFDIVSEFFPHVSIILYRVYPNEHTFLAKVFLVAGVTTLFGTLMETIVTMWLFGSLWKQWTIAFKVTTPILHCLFAACQLWGTWNFYGLWKKQKRLIAEEKSRFDGGERGLSLEETKRTNISINERAISSNSADSTAREPTVESRIL